MKARAQSLAPTKKLGFDDSSLEFPNWRCKKNGISRACWPANLVEARSPTFSERFCLQSKVGSQWGRQLGEAWTRKTTDNDLGLHMHEHVYTHIYMCTQSRGGQERGQGERRGERNAHTLMNTYTHTFAYTYTKA